ncbi:uncharacterized protein OE_6139F (plasmid) [Halobacterium salinarum R1]|uniref:Uncharacterized protein n=1 Tax=Halobacterium salinarum (strain ATCC 29341 / DSM 671 / R1) TaxID=478009 RepID=B0R9J0_HALS3|nr:uncharacterized protein OE_6139F [Halobacterium salinarum R1]
MEFDEDLFDFVVLSERTLVFDSPLGSLAATPRHTPFPTSVYWQKQNCCRSPLTTGSIRSYPRRTRIPQES